MEGNMKIEQKIEVWARRSHNLDLEERKRKEEKENFERNSFKLLVFCENELNKDLNGLLYS